MKIEIQIADGVFNLFSNHIEFSFKIGLVPHIAALADKDLINSRLRMARQVPQDVAADRYLAPPQQFLSLLGHKSFKPILADAPLGLVRG